MDPTGLGYRSHTILILPSLRVRPTPATSILLPQFKAELGFGLKISVQPCGCLGRRKL